MRRAPTSCAIRHGLQSRSSIPLIFLERRERLYGRPRCGVELHYSRGREDGCGGSQLVVPKITVIVEDCFAQVTMPCAARPMTRVSSSPGPRPATQ